MQVHHFLNAKFTCSAVSAGSGQPYGARGSAADGQASCAETDQ